MNVGFVKWLRLIAGMGVCGVATLAAPQVAHPAADSGPKVLKIAVSLPRSQKAAIQEKKYNRRLADMTDNEVQFRVYWGGAAGGERDVLRKMRTGQIDGSPFGLEITSTFVREAMVLQSPGLFLNYKQVDAVRAALTPEFDAEAYRNGFKILGWGDVGRLRVFSKSPISLPSDLKKVRPWLYPESETLKTMYRMIGATGVPLGIQEVYGAMETGMIDTFWGTAVLASALQWHRTGKYVSADGLGFISGAFALRREAWDSLSERAQGAILEMIKERARENQLEMRRDDDRAYEKLKTRGYTAIESTPKARDAWWALGINLRKQLVGRIYTPELVKRAEEIALKFADEEQRKRLSQAR